MERKQGLNKYSQTIYDILAAQDKDIEWKLSELEKMYRIKPVRACWYAAKARLILEKEKVTKNVYPILRGKFYSELEYEGLIEIWELYAQLDGINRENAMVEYRRFWISRIMKKEYEIEKAVMLEKRAEKEALEDLAGIEKLASRYLISSKLVNYQILKLFDMMMKRNRISRRDWIENISNFGYLKEAVLRKQAVVIVTDRPEQQNEALILGHCFFEMGLPVYALTSPEAIEIDAPIAMQDTVAISLDNRSEQYGIIVIPAIELILAGKSLGNNCAHIIDSLYGEDAILILASSMKFEELSGTEVLKNRIDNLYGFQENFRKDYFSFGWTGSYLSYIEQLYNMDVEEALHRQPHYRFSIVIPARNSAGTLQHTLKTCLNQRWKGDFEIVISDNSTEGNNEVCQFCQTLQDKRIKYYKTPRDLRLNRSFEYAFLQTRGEYVLSVGSDDALLPWTLEVWDQVIRDYPEEEIFAWDRGFYAWPGFNGGQQHQFTVPGKYKRGKYHAEYVEPIQYLSWAMDSSGMMYLLPMLYINSGFRRSFMQTLLNDTGRLWDGICQDIYMGVIVSVIKEKIVKIHYPLSIAGMSNGSVGAIANLPVTDQAKGITAAGRELKENNVGGFSKSQIETLMPELGSDVTSLYNSILRAVSRGLIPRHYLSDVFDWKKWFMNSYQVMNKEDIYFDKKIHQMRFAAMKHGEEFLNWFDETIYGEALKPEILPERDKTIKTYQEYDNERGMTLDASKYGVYNSYEASLLFERMTGL